MWTQLLNECLDRTGRRVMLVSILLGILAGLGVSRIVQVTGEFWSNTGLLLLIGGSIAFGLDLFFISPVRLWRDTKAELSVANGELRALRAAPPVGMQIGHVDTQINIQVSDGAELRVSASSNTIIVGQDSGGDTRSTRHPPSVGYLWDPWVQWGTRCNSHAGQWRHQLRAA